MICEESWEHKQGTFIYWSQAKELVEGSVIKHSPWAGTEPNSRISPLPCLSKMVSEGSIVEVLPYLRGDWSPGEGFFLLILILPCYNLSPLTIVMYTSKAEATVALLGHIKLLICQFFSVQLLLVSCSAVYFCVLDYFWLNIEFCICFAVNCDHWSYFTLSM